MSESFSEPDISEFGEWRQKIEEANRNNIFATVVPVVLNG
jgi:hypothetical protein